ncbi:transcription termination factor [Candidatus Phytoplasma luffae]|uniref:Transcription termination/antitermination protein NusA n=1 Tax=Loofah witches'-broom phytoplasma TaxID=35773 RepID=A0A975FIS6_LOWBP|nr:transcription termination factor NusA [Candidatus Phytoplasma luffae]QTX02698.1 transcription termination factor [Candidatus Phytoplasma luffae]
MKTKKILDNIETLAKDEELTKEQVLEAFEKSLISGCKKHCQVKSCRLTFNKNYEEYSLYKEYLVTNSDNVIEENENIDYKKITTINLEEARKIKKNAKIGDIIQIEVDPKQFNFYACKDLKNKLNEEIIKFKRENIYNFFKNYENKLISGKIISINEKFFTLELEKQTQALLLKKETLKNDNFSLNERIQVYVIEVQKTNKLPKIFISRTHVNYVLEIFKEVIPEIQEGLIEIISIAREPSTRVKIGLLSRNPDIDAVGSCIGEKSNRIKNITKILKGEKIDLFLWSDDPKKLINNALQPAKINEIQIIDLDKKIASVLIDKEQFSLAIGKSGNNIRLATQVTKWNITLDKNV